VAGQSFLPGILILAGAGVYSRARLTRADAVSSEAAGGMTPVATNT
jgi:hypothetical protein